MNAVPNLESFFTQRLMKQRLASPNTIKSYRDTFHLLVQFIQERYGKQPSRLELTELDAPLISAFLDEMEKSRSISARSRNARLAAIRILLSVCRVRGTSSVGANPTCAGNSF